LPRTRRDRDVSADTPGRGRDASKPGYDPGPRAPSTGDPCCGRGQDDQRCYLELVVQRGKISLHNVQS